MFRRRVLINRKRLEGKNREKSRERKAEVVIRTEEQLGKEGRTKTKKYKEIEADREKRE